jgi:hypothetical protein
MNDQITRTATIGLITITVLAVGVVVAASPVAAQSGELTVDDSISVPQGEEQTIAVTYDGDVEPAGFEYVLTYDPDVITVTNHQSGDYFSASISPTINAGNISYFSTGSADGTSGTVSLITITPTRGAEPGATTTLSFEDDETSGSYDDGEVGTISLTTTDGKVQVKEGTTIEDKVSGLTEPTDELKFDDLNTAIQRYQNGEPVDGTELTFDDLIYLIELYHDQQ